MHLISHSIDMPTYQIALISKSLIGTLKFIIILMQKTVDFQCDWSQFTSVYALNHKSTDLMFKGLIAMTVLIYITAI